MQIEKIDFYGMSAIHFEAGGYEAIMIPEIGANVVKLSFRHKYIANSGRRRNRDFQRTTSSIRTSAFIPS